MNMNIKKFIKESILKSIQTQNENGLDELFNYYTSKKDLEETNFNFKVPKRKYGDNVIESLINIIMTSEGISEKSFSKFDEVIDRAKNIILQSPEYIQIIKEGKEKKYRPAFCAESIFSKL